MKAEEGGIFKYLTSRLSLVVCVVILLRNFILAVVQEVYDVGASAFVIYHLASRELDFVDAYTNRILRLPLSNLVLVIRV